MQRRLHLTIFNVPMLSARVRLFTRLFRRPFIFLKEQLIHDIDPPFKVCHTVSSLQQKTDLLAI